MTGKEVLATIVLKYATVSLSSALYRIGGKIIRPAAPFFSASDASLTATDVACSAIVSTTGALPFKTSVAKTNNLIFSSFASVLASPREPPIIMPSDPAATCVLIFFSNNAKSSLSSFVNGVSIAGNTPSHVVVCIYYLLCEDSAKLIFIRKLQSEDTYKSQEPI